MVRVGAWTSRIESRFWLSVNNGCQAGIFECTIDSSFCVEMMAVIGLGLRREDAL